jgi:hypothetical protein
MARGVSGGARHPDLVGTAAVRELLAESTDGEGQPVTVSQILVRSNFSRGKFEGEPSGITHAIVFESPEPENGTAKQSFICRIRRSAQARVNQCAHSGVSDRDPGRVRISLPLARRVIRHWRQPELLYRYSRAVKDARFSRQLISYPRPVSPSFD